MKVLTLVVTLCLGLAAGYTIDDGDVLLYREIRQNGITPYIMEANIRNIIENIKQKLRDSHLDPWQIEHYDVNLTYPGLIDLKGSLDQSLITNLSQFDPTDVKLTLLPMKLILGLAFQPIDGNGQYNIDGDLVDLIPIYGNGNFEFHVQGLSVHVVVELSSKGGEVYVKNLDLALGLGGLYFNATNFLGGPLGEIVSEVVNDNAVDWFNRFVYAYGDKLEGLVSQVANGWLKGKTVQDIIDMITGVTTKAPTPTTSAKFF